MGKTSYLNVAGLTLVFVSATCAFPRELILKGPANVDILEDKQAGSKTVSLNTSRAEEPLSSNRDLTVTEKDDKDESDIPSKPAFVELITPNLTVVAGSFTTLTLEKNNTEPVSNATVTEVLVPSVILISAGHNDTDLLKVSDQALNKLKVPKFDAVPIASLRSAELESLLESGRRDPVIPKSAVDKVVADSGNQATGTLKVAKMENPTIGTRGSQLEVDVAPATPELRAHGELLALSSLFDEEAFIRNVPVSPAPPTMPPNIASSPSSISAEKNQSKVPPKLHTRQEPLPEAKENEKEETAVAPVAESKPAAEESSAKAPSPPPAEEKQIEEPVALDGKNQETKPTLILGPTEAPESTTSMPPVETSSLSPVESTSLPSVETTAVPPTESTTVSLEGPSATTEETGASTTASPPTESTFRYPEGPLPIPTVTLPPEGTSTVLPEESTSTVPPKTEKPETEPKPTVGPKPAVLPTKGPGKPVTGGEKLPGIPAIPGLQHLKPDIAEKIPLEVLQNLEGISPGKLPFPPQIEGAPAGLPSQIPGGLPQGPENLPPPPGGPQFQKFPGLVPPPFPENFPQPGNLGPPIPPQGPENVPAFPSNIPGGIPQAQPPQMQGNLFGPMLPGGIEQLPGAQNMRPPPLPQGPGEENLGLPELPQGPGAENMGLPQFPQGPGMENLRPPHLRPGPGMESLRPPQFLQGFGAENQGPPPLPQVPSNVPSLMPGMFPQEPPNLLPQNEGMLQQQFRPEFQRPQGNVPPPRRPQFPIGNIERPLNANFPSGQEGGFPHQGRPPYEKYPGPGVPGHPRPPRPQENIQGNVFPSGRPGEFPLQGKENMGGPNLPPMNLPQGPSSQGQFPPPQSGAENPMNFPPQPGPGVMMGNPYGRPSISNMPVQPAQGTFADFYAKPHWTPQHYIQETYSQPACTGLPFGWDADVSSGSSEER